MLTNPTLVEAIGAMMSSRDEYVEFEAAHHVVKAALRVVRAFQHCTCVVISLSLLFLLRSLSRHSVCLFRSLCSTFVASLTCTDTDTDTDLE